jgi:Recombinase
MKNNELINQTHPLITPDHLRRLAVIYIRQSTEEQVRDNTGSTDFQRSLAAVAQSFGWPDSLIEIIDEDLGRSGSSSERRTGWQRLQTMIAKAGIQIPARHGQRISFIKPTLDRVRKILVHPAYAGTYVYGRTESQPGGPVLARGELQRIKIPEERWIKIFNHHPAYMTLEQQEEIKSILKKNHFQRRDRAGRGPALTQGLLRCARCNASFRVQYLRYRTYGYDCAWSVEPCTRFASYEFDRYILTEVFKVLKTPPLEMLRAALEETRSQERTRRNWIESERERLAHEEQRARDRADLTRSSLPRVHLDALEKLEKVLEEKEQFEQKIAIKLSVPKTDESDEDLEELCRRASDVPSLWGHPAVTHQERKEILRCVIDHIVVAATKERIDAKIFWKSGGQTPFSLWSVGGRHNLIRELHSQKLTTLEIQEHLLVGMAEFYSRNLSREIMKGLKQRAPPRSSGLWPAFWLPKGNH